MLTNNKKWYRWMASYSIRDLIIMGGVAAIGRLLVFGYSDSALVKQHDKISWIMLVIAGVAEGLLIGTMEWKSLSKLIPLKLTGWLTVTILSSVAGWLFIVSPAIVYISLLSRFSAVHEFYLVIYAGIAGMCFGALMGMPQQILLGKFYSNSVVWIFANASAWMCSFVIIYSAFFIYTRSTVANVMITSLACGASGLLQAFLTGLGLHYSMILRKEKVLPVGR